MAIGDDIRRARKAAQMTQKQLADKMGVSSQMISQWESGARNPRYDTMKQIEEALGQPLSSMYSDESMTDWIGNKPGEYREPLELVAVHTLQRLNHDGLIRALSMLEDLAKVPEYQKKEQ